MSNERTTIRFHGEEPGDVPPVAPERLLRLTQAMEALYPHVTISAGFQGTVRLLIADSPRRGSLEISLINELSIFDQAVDRQSWVALQSEVLSTVADMAAIATLFWEVIWAADRGVVSTIRSKSRGEITSEMVAAPPRSIDALKIKLVTAALENPRVVAGVKELIEAAAIAGVRELDVSVLDHRPVVLYGTEDRFDVMLLARNGRPDADLPEEEAGQDPPRTLEMKRVSEDLVPATWDNNPAEVFIAEAEGLRWVVIWRARVKPPSQGSSVVATVHRPSRQRFRALQMKAAIPPEFENAARIVLASRGGYLE